MLVLHDSTGNAASVAELDALQAGQLVAHFGTWERKAAAEYTSGDLSKYSAAIYVGSVYDAPLPPAFLDDVLAGQTPLFWIGANIWQLVARQDTALPSFATRYGWRPTVYGRDAVAGIRYRDTTLPRLAENTAGIMTIDLVAGGSTARVLADVQHVDGSTHPYAIGSANLTYLGETPFGFSTDADRSLVFADLLFDLLRPATTSRHRALVRIEDVSPLTSPAQLSAITNLLVASNVPFAIELIPVHSDPLGAQHGGIPTEVRLADRPALTTVLNDAIKQGATLVLHGLTHQYGATANPDNGASGADFEFYRAVRGADGSLQLLGPVAEDSTSWATNRFERARAEVKAAGLPVPQMVTPAHHAASPNVYAAIAQMFAARYDRPLIFASTPTGETDFTRPVNQAFPYVVNDVYGSVVIPENLGWETIGADGSIARGPESIVAAARRLLVVRDGVASFFWHPTLVDHPGAGIGHLAKVVDEMKLMGYVFTTPDALLNERLTSKPLTSKPRGPTK